MEKSEKIENKPENFTADTEFSGLHFGIICVKVTLKNGNEQNVSSKDSMKELFESNEFYTNQCP